MPLATRLITCATEMRRPRIAARPASTSGFCVIRSKVFATSREPILARCRFDSRCPLRPLGKFWAVQTSNFRLQTLNSTRNCEGFVEHGLKEAGGREWPFTYFGWIHRAARGAGGPARRGAGSVALPRSCPLVLASFCRSQTRNESPRKMSTADV